MTDDDRKVARPLKSQRYPFIPLGRAVDRARELYKVADRHEVPLSTAAKAWGYSEKSSGAHQSVAALITFGLLEDRGAGGARRLKLSDAALRLIRDPRENSPDRLPILQAMAMAPMSHRDLWEQFNGPPPSEELALVHLRLDKGFGDAAAEEFLKEFMSTIQFAGLDSPEIDSEPPAERVTEAPVVEHRPTPPRETKAEVPAMSGERVVFTHEVDPQHHLRVLVSGAVDEEVLDALEMYLELQRKRLNRRQATGDASHERPEPQ